MKLHELRPDVLIEERLDEITTRQVLAAGTLAAAALGISFKHGTTTIQKPILTKKQDQQAALEGEIDRLTQAVTSRYDVDEAEARSIVLLAKRYEKPEFPKARDILAIIGIESSFNAAAVSKLKKDPAVGLMQVRPTVWGIKAAELRNNVSKQVQFGSDVLHRYYLKLKDREAAVQAYNVGLTNFNLGKQPEAQRRYLQKYTAELAELQ